MFVIALATGFTRATNSGAAMVSEESSERMSTLSSMAKQPHQKTCERRRPVLARGVVGRRLATWHWQDELELVRTKTRFVERTAIGCAYLEYVRHTWAERADRHWRLYAKLTRDVTAAVCFVFKRYCSQALAVVRCESGGSTRAHNGQYLGLFQMGSGERARYGHGDTPLEQARAAYRYFVASGRDWSPWQCRPWGGLAW